MTLVLTCLLPDYVVQVADSRLSRARPNGIEIVNEHAWKATVLESRAVIGYSGLANFAVDGSEPTDLWLADQAALRLASISECAESLAAAATERFSRLSPRIPEDARRHAFILAGWNDLATEPSIGVVSNALERDHRWAQRPAQAFAVQHYRLEGRRFLLRGVGVHLGPVFRTLEDHVRAALSSAGPVHRVVAALCDGVRTVARSNETVGDELLVTVLPRVSSGAQNTGLRILDSVQENAPSFLFLPGGSSGTLVGRYPNYVGGTMTVAHAQIHNRALTPEEIRERYLRQKHEFERRNLR